MKNLQLLALALALASCGGGDTKATPDASPVTPDAAAAQCFSGTPQSHDDLINACVDSSVTTIVKYRDLAAQRAAMPHLNPDGSIPILP